MVIVIAPIAGPVLGGWITDNYSWPWLVYINLPVGLLAAAVSWSLLRNRESHRVRVPVDIVGLLLLVIGVGALQFLLDNGNNKDWFDSTEIVVAAVVAVVALTFLLPWEMKDKHPIVDLHLFQRRNFTVGTVTLAVAFFAFMGVNIIFPLWLQTTLGYTATWAGLAMAPIGIVALLVAPVMGRNIAKVNLRLAATMAFVIFGGCMLWVAGQNETNSFAQLTTPRLVMGLGVSMFFLPLNQIIMSGMPQSELASAAGLSNFLRTIAGSIATAVCVFWWNSRSEFHYGRLVEHVAPDSVGFLDYQANLAQHGISGTPALGQISQVIQQQAMTLGANDLFYVLAMVFIAMIPMVWLAKPPFKTIGMGGGH
jgi:DHA2 family multidrug resistance protein